MLQLNIMMKPQNLVIVILLQQPSKRFYQISINPQRDPTPPKGAHTDP